MKKKILVTGCAGFIGFHLSNFLLKKKFEIIGIDDLNDYYDVRLKKKRLKLLNNFKNFKFLKEDISKINFIKKIKNQKIWIIFHLAAQAGVRFSLLHPEKYLRSNISGTFNLLEFCRKNNINKFIFASSSSVYGQSKKNKFSETDITDSPLQFYAATKKSAEVMIKSYCNLYKIQSLALRFFTVYGPYGRPDMAVYKFVKKIKSNQTIALFNYGRHSRDFTYIDDVIKNIYHLSFKKNLKKNNFEVFNIAAGKNEKLIDLVKIIEKVIKKKAKIKYEGLQTGDMQDTHADVSKLKKEFYNYKPTSLNKGIKKFIEWYEDFYK